VTYYVLFFLHLESRRVSVGASRDIRIRSGWNKSPRSATQETWGYLDRCRYVLHDRDTKFCASFRSVLAAGGVKTVPLPARSPESECFCGTLGSLLFGGATIPTMSAGRGAHCGQLIAHGPRWRTVVYRATGQQDREDHLRLCFRMNARYSSSTFSSSVVSPWIVNVAAFARLFPVVSVLVEK
jgi:hypothetical protein